MFSVPLLSLPGLVLAWKEADPSPSARKLAQDNYVGAVRRTFDGSDLAIVSYLRGCIEDQGGPNSFGQLLWSALYSRLDEDEAFTPEPNHLHRHLVSLFSEYPRRLWTTNYDDLLEEAARRNGLEVSTLDPLRRLASDRLLVTHLHGFLAPEGREQGHPGPDEAPVVLAEDDYHLVAAGTANWTDQGYYRLFGEHGVLIMGMSLTDPNLRRVLSILSPEGDTPGATRHFAVMTSIEAEHLRPKRIGSAARERLARDANGYRRDYWARRGVEVIELPDHESVSSFLVRLRYETFGDAPGDLWRKGAELGHGTALPWRGACQHAVAAYLNAAKGAIARDFDLTDPSEIVEIGVFLLKPGEAKTLELVFRAGRGAPAVPGARRFSADPDRPTGLAGRVMVSGDVVAVPRDDALHD